jgi:hypothetical protein
LTIDENEPRHAKMGLNSTKKCGKKVYQNGKINGKKLVQLESFLYI